jgi:hypothetical protein
MFIAAAREAPRWAITDDEAERLAQGFARFAKWYDFPEISEKIADHYVFAMACGMVWGTRLLAELNDSRKGRHPQPPIVTVVPDVAQQPQAAGTTNGREPPDPRNWRKETVEGFGAVDIPPVTGNIN